MSKSNKRKQPEYKIIVEYAEPDENGYVPTLEELMNSDRFKVIVKKIILRGIQKKQEQKEQ